MNLYPGFTHHKVRTSGKLIVSVGFSQQLAFSDNEDAVEGDSNRKDLRKDRSEKPRGKEDEKEKGEIDRRSVSHAQKRMANNPCGYTF